MKYYRFINGKRYDRSLINFANFKVKGQGDGRISIDDAKEVWRVAMDGGRITEIEDDTLRYLLNELNWTDSARDWITAELLAGVQKVSSYYRIIDGLKYDRAILEKAQVLVDENQAKSISLEDAKILLPLFNDFGDVRIEEERALTYITKHYKWTKAAEDWFLPQVHAISKESDAYGNVNYIVTQEFQLTRLWVDVAPEDLKDQLLEYQGTVNFAAALRNGLSNLMSSIEPRTLGRFIINQYGLNPGEVEDWEAQKEGRIRELLGNASLTLIGEGSQTGYPLPASGETLKDNWIFGLTLYDLSSDYSWIVVPRNGNPVYSFIDRPGGDS